MRDDNRIEPLLHEIYVLWMRHPDLRFGQVVDIIKNRLEDVFASDIFYIEDNEIMEMLKDWNEGK